MGGMASVEVDLDGVAHLAGIRWAGLDGERHWLRTETDLTGGSHFAGVENSPTNEDRSALVQGPRMASCLSSWSDDCRDPCAVQGPRLDHGEKSKLKVVVMRI